MGECSRDLAQTSKSFCEENYMDTISSVAVNDQDMYKMSLWLGKHMSITVQSSSRKLVTQAHFCHLASLVTETQNLEEIPRHTS